MEIDQLVKTSKQQKRKRNGVTQSNGSALAAATKRERGREGRWGRCYCYVKVLSKLS